MEDLKTPKGHFEINLPLVQKKELEIDVEKFELCVLKFD